MQKINLLLQPALVLKPLFEGNICYENNQNISENAKKQLLKTKFIRHFNVKESML